MRASFFKFIRCWSFNCSSTLQCGQFVQILGLAVNLTNLKIHRCSMWPFEWPQALHCIELSTLASLSVYGHQEFIEGLLSTISTPMLLALDVFCTEVESSGRMFRMIGATHSLQHLHFEFNAYDRDWELRDMLSWFDELTALTTLRFLSSIPDSDDPESFTAEDAHTIAEFFPNLRVLAVALATFDFFIQIVQLPLLEDLRLNAYLWSAGHRDDRTTPCPALTSLRFTGSPEHWVLGPAGCPDAVKAERFPNISTLEVVTGTGDILGDPSFIGP